MVDQNLVKASALLIETSDEDFDRSSKSVEVAIRLEQLRILDEISNTLIAMHEIMEGQPRKFSL